MADVAAAEQAAAAEGQQRQQQAEQPASTTAEPKAEEDEDADETCGFCRFMKGGGCRAAFTVSVWVGARGALPPASRCCLRPQPSDSLPLDCLPRPAGSTGALRAHAMLPDCAASPCASLQSWSECVDQERGSGGDFTEECREKV